MALNIELFKKIRERIATIPESYNQEHWCSPSKSSPCGTSACLAGEAIICAAPSVEEGIAELKRLERKKSVPERAAELLGLEGEWAAYAGLNNEESGGETLIFDGAAMYWPEPFRERFHAGDEAGAAVAFLDHIIETGKVTVSEYPIA